MVSGDLENQLHFGENGTNTYDVCKHFISIEKGNILLFKVRLRLIVFHEARDYIDSQKCIHSLFEQH